MKKATVHPQVTKTMDDIIKFVQDLIDLGYAYESDGDVYYRARKFKGYGKLSGKNIDDLISGARIAVDEKKEDPLRLRFVESKKRGKRDSVGVPWGNGKTGMAYRMFGHVKEVPGGHYRHSRRRPGPAVPSSRK